MRIDMNLTEVKKMKKGEGPYTKDTMYKISSLHTYPSLIYKVGGILMFDWDEWGKMAAKAKAENIKKAAGLRAVKV